MPNVIVYHVCIGQKDRYSNVGIIYRVDGFRDDALVKAFIHTFDMIHIFFILN